MANVTEHKKFVLVDPVDNHNKFWAYSIYDDGTVTYDFGRVGVTCTTTPPKPYVAKTHESVVKSKVKKGYNPITILGNETSTGIKVAGRKVESKEEIKKLAAEEIGAGDPVVAKLVTKLAEANRHELQVATGGEVDIDLSTGIVRTAMGVVTAEAVTKARTILDDMTPLVKKHDYDNEKFTKDLGAYLCLVPQKTPAARGWHRTFLTSQSDLSKQSTLLDQIEASIELATKRVTEAEKNRGAEKKVAKAFEVTMKLIDDKKTIDMVNKLYTSTRQTMHSSSRLKPVRVYEVCIPQMKAAFEADGAKLSNQKLLWHGTRMFNVLSILKRGMVLPKTLSTMQIAGAMFGNGLYFSDQSTKSLNYAHGYWDGGKRDSTCYMFLADVAMGKEYIPSGPCNGQRAGYDSCHAIGGRSGVVNDEQIVYRTSQANIRYLIEFSE